jgi:hypothetical protein
MKSAARRPWTVAAVFLPLVAFAWVYPGHYSTGELAVSVHDAVADGAVPNATVALTCDEGNRVSRTTNAAGTADFRGLHSGDRCLVTISQPHYVTAHYCADERSSCSDRVEIPPAPKFERITVRLERAGMVSGTVRDSGGMPVKNAILMLLGARFGDLSDVVPVMGTVSAKTGHFEIQSVPPGRYYLGVHAPKEHRVENGRELMPSVVYFPGTERSEDASPVEVSAQKNNVLKDLTLPLKAGVSVTGSIAAKFSAGQVRLYSDVHNNPRWLYPLSTLSSPSRQFTFTAVPPGRYRVYADLSPGASAASRDWCDFEVGVTPVTLPILTPTLPAYVSGVIRYAGSLAPGGASKVPALTVSLEPERTGFGDYASSEADNDAFSFPEVSPGEYQVVIGGLPKTWYVQQIRYNGDPVHKVLTIQHARRGRLEVSVAPGGGAIDANVAQGGDRQVVIVVLMDENGGALVTVKATERGEAHFNNLAPGNYRLTTFSSPEFRAYLLPQSRRTLLSRSVSVHLGPSSEVRMELTMLGVDPELAAASPTATTCCRER